MISEESKLQSNDDLLHRFIEEKKLQYNAYILLIISMDANNRSSRMDWDFWAPVFIPETLKKLSIAAVTT